MVKVQLVRTDLHQSMEANMRLHIGAAILILLGIIIFLLINLDIAPAAELKKLLAQGWPLLLIVVGVTVMMRPAAPGRGCLVAGGSPL